MDGNRRVAEGNHQVSAVRVGVAVFGPACVRAGAGSGSAVTGGGGKGDLAVQGGADGDVAELGEGGQGGVPADPGEGPQLGLVPAEQVLSGFEGFLCRYVGSR